MFATKKIGENAELDKIWWLRLEAPRFARRNRFAIVNRFKSSARYARKIKINPKMGFLFIFGGSDWT